MTCVLGAPQSWQTSARSWRCEVFPRCAAWQIVTLVCRHSLAPAQVCIFTKGGALLWTWQMAALRGLPVDALIRTCLLEERSGESSFSYTPPSGAAYTLKWTLHNVRSSYPNSWTCV